MWVKNCGETFFLFILRICAENTGYLGEDTNGMHGIQIRYDIAVRMFVLEKESTKIRLTAFHHILDGSDDVGVPYDDSFIETGEERTANDG